MIICPKDDVACQARQCPRSARMSRSRPAPLSLTATEAIAKLVTVGARSSL